MKFGQIVLLYSISYSDRLVAEASQKILRAGFPLNDFKN